MNKAKPQYYAKPFLAGLLVIFVLLAFFPIGRTLARNVLLSDQPETDTTAQEIQSSASPNSVWVIETVDDVDEVGKHTSMALDASDWPHISYSDATNNNLKYAYYDGSIWQIEIADSIGSVGLYSSLVLSASDLPHISHYNNTGGDLKYAYYDGGIWQIATPDTDGYTGLYTSIDLDTLGHPHISYVRNTESPYPDPTPFPLNAGEDAPNGLRNLRYAYYDGSSWSALTVVAGIGSEGGHTSLALDSANLPHISYYDSNSDDLIHVWHDGAVWQSETVDSAGDVGLYTSLVLDASDYPHISYHDQLNGALKYAYYDGTWHTETVDSVGNVGWYSSLALDSAGRPHISYLDYSVGDLKYAYDDGTSWQIQTVDSTGATGGYTSLALDGNNFPHISYYDYSNHDLKYAHLQCVPVSGASIGGPALLPVDSNGVYTATYSPITATTPVTFTWDNGSTGPSASYSWPEAGTYTITVTATNLCGQAQDTFVVDVCQPVEGVGIDGPTDLLVGETGLYTASYTPPTASLPVAITWDNGSTGPTAAYSWTTPGTYTVTVTATNPCGQVQNTFVVDVCQPVEGINIDGPADLLVDEVGTYTATFSPPTATLPMTYTWDNGSTGPTAAYSWTAPGTYTITVTATNPCGQVQDTFVVDVCQPVEGVGISGPTNLLVGETGLYTATFSPPTATLPVTITWDNGSTGPTAAYSWTTPGTYTVTVTATNPCGQVQDSLVVYVCQPVQGVSIDGPGGVLVGDVGIYTATFSPPTATLPMTYTWDNGSTGPTAAYSWTAPGTYTITVTVTNDCGQAQADLTVIVGCQPVEGVTISGPANLLVGETSLYTASYTPPTATLPVTITWDNGTTGPTASYSWPETGTYTITVTATNLCGQIQDTLVVYVCQPVEGINIDGPANLLVDEAGTYTATFSPPTATLPVTITWDNGTTGPTASYSWPETGTYTITVTATSDCGQAQNTFTVTVRCQPVEAVTINGPANLLVGETGLYTASYTPPTATLPMTYTWDNGNTGPTAAYSWPAPGTYTVTVTATNDCGQAQHTFVVDVCQPVEGVTISGPTDLLAGETGLYTATYTPSTATLSMAYTWNNDGTGPTAAYSWTVPGTYTITITATNACGQAQNTLTVKVWQSTWHLYMPLVYNNQVPLQGQHH